MDKFRHAVEIIDGWNTALSSRVSMKVYNEYNKKFFMDLVKQTVEFSSKYNSFLECKKCGNMIKPDNVDYENIHKGCGGACT